MNRYKYAMIPSVCKTCANIKRTYTNILIISFLYDTTFSKKSKLVTKLFVKCEVGDFGYIVCAEALLLLVNKVYGNKNKCTKVRCTVYGVV